MKAKMSTELLRIVTGRVIFESLMIMFSILAALGINDWTIQRDTKRLVDRTVIAFEAEVTQNLRWIEESIPYHNGIKQVVAQYRQNKIPISVEWYQQILSDFKPSVLRESAWETAVATGSITEIDFELVSALSLTYSLQNRFQESYDTGFRELLGNAYWAEGRSKELLYRTDRFINDATEAEAEIRAVYLQVLKELQSYRERANVPKEG